LLLVGQQYCLLRQTLFLKLNKVIALTAQVPASATVIYVNSATGTDSPSAGNTEAAPYKTITALSQAQPNTVIQLAPGNYTKTGKSSHWLSNKALRFVGMNPPKARTR